MYLIYTYDHIRYIKDSNVQISATEFKKDFFNLVDQVKNKMTNIKDNLVNLILDTHTLIWYAEGIEVSNRINRKSKRT